MKTIMTKLEDFIDEVIAVAEVKRVFFILDNNVTPVKIANEKGEEEVSQRAVSTFRLSAGWTKDDQKKEQWLGCNIVLLNELMSSDEKWKEADKRINEDKEKILEKLKDRLSSNAIVICEGAVYVEGK